MACVGVIVAGMYILVGLNLIIVLLLRYFYRVREDNKTKVYVKKDGSKLRVNNTESDLDNNTIESG